MPQTHSSKNIALITGSIPPMRCGVGDYSSNLAKAVSSCGNKVFLYTSALGVSSTSLKYPLSVQQCVTGWTIREVVSGFIGFKKSLFFNNIGCVNVQYPTVGYGYLLGPQFLVALLKLFSDVAVVSTIHEFRSAHILRKISIIPFLVFSDKLIFTAEEEVDSIRKMFGPLFLPDKSRYAVLPVGSNISILSHSVPQRRDKFVVFFGLFYPGRRLEFVADIYRSMAEKDSNVVFAVIGDTHPKHLNYYHKIRALFESGLRAGQLEWHIGEDPEQISNLLSLANLAILPYPDGASFRRTTLMAAMSAGVPIISTCGPNTPVEFKDGENIIFAKDKDDFVEKALALLADPEHARHIAERAKQFSRAFSWESIASRYISFIANKGTL